jgi:hypothetical protein
MAAGSSKDIKLFVKRLWRHTCLRAAGAPDFVLKEGEVLVRKSMSGFDPDKNQHLIATALFDHILEHTSQFYEPPFCLTCKKITGCGRQEDGTCDCCGDYEMDVEAYDTCRAQLYRAVKLLDGDFGFDSMRMILALNGLLDAMKSS